MDWKAGRQGGGAQVDWLAGHQGGGAQVDFCLGFVFCVLCFVLD